MEIIQRRSALHRLRAGLKKNALTLGFMGGSITAGDENSGGMESNWPLFIQNWFVSNFPGLRLKICNAAYGGTGSISGLMRVDKEILQPKCDVVFVEYAVNDYFEDMSAAEELKWEEEGLLRRLLQAGCDVVMVYTYRRQMHKDMAAGRVPLIIRQLDDIAAHYNLNTVWAGRHAMDQLNSGRITWECWLPISGQNLHPDYYGSSIYAEPVLQLLQDEINRKEEGSAPLQRELPAPLEKNCYAMLKEIPFSEINYSAPWCLLRELKIPWYNKVLYTCADGAELSFPFRGRALMVSLNFGKRCGFIEYQIDGGEWKRLNVIRADWVPIKDWCVSVLVEKQLENTDHIFHMRTVFEDEPDCLGSECKILSFMSVIG